MRGEKSTARELKTLLKAMDKAGLTSGTVVTYEDEEEITEGEKRSGWFPHIDISMVRRADMGVGIVSKSVPTPGVARDCGW